MTKRKRAYDSSRRSEAADDTKRRILKAAVSLFGSKGIDRVTVAEIGNKAKVAASTVFATYKSKEGILRSLMQQSLFGDRFRKAQEHLDGVSDPIKLIELTSHVSRAIYESESAELGLLRNTSGFSPALAKIEQEFERIRLEMQEERINLLFASGKERKGLKLADARRILWMYTSRDVYRMLVSEGGWTANQYQEWLSQTLLAALVDSAVKQ